MGWEEWRDSRKDGYGLDVTNPTSDTALMDAIHKEDTEMVKKILKEQKIERAKVERSSSETAGRSYANDSSKKDPYCSSSNQIIKPCKREEKRVTIHMMSESKNGKLILLPSSIEELLRLASEKFGGCNFTKITNADNAEIDDLDVIWDGDHLYFSSNWVWKLDFIYRACISADNVFLPGFIEKSRLSKAEYTKLTLIDTKTQSYFTAWLWYIDTVLFEHKTLFYTSLLLWTCFTW